MKVKLVNRDNAIGLIDPHTKRSPFVVPAPTEDDPSATRVVDVADVPETTFWVRRVLHGELVRISETAQPVGNEPIKPLTTR